jgi:long-chain acyl-CoA synthetase
LTYQEVGNRIDRLALGLHSMGLRSGDKVMIYADTCAEWLIMAMACFKSSLTIVTIYTNLGKSGVSFSINQVSEFRISKNKYKITLVGHMQVQSVYC